MSETQPKIAIRTTSEPTTLNGDNYGKITRE